jgi:hypothetical protein
MKGVGSHLDENHSASASVVSFPAANSGAGYGDDELPKGPKVPCFRWISTSRSARPLISEILPTMSVLTSAEGTGNKRTDPERNDAPKLLMAKQQQEGEEKSIRFSFSVPFELLPGYVPPKSSTEGTPVEEEAQDEDGDAAASTAAPPTREVSLAAED